MYIYLENGMDLKDSDEVFICDDDYVNWENAVKLYGFPKKYDEENMMPIRRKISTMEELFTSYNSGRQFAPQICKLFKVGQPCRLVHSGVSGTTIRPEQCGKEACVSKLLPC